MKLTLTTFIFLILLSSCKKDTEQNSFETANIEIIKEVTITPDMSEAEIIAAKNGIANWENVSQLEFAFNVAKGGKDLVKRAWIWNPKTNDVTMQFRGDTLSYNRSKIEGPSLAADQGFINDKFWLLAPYQPMWDQGTKITLQDTATAPISQSIKKKLTVLYDDEGGYTPGDAYDYYYDDDYVIDEWVFRKSNIDTATMKTTFEKYETHAGLHIPTSHKGPDGFFHLYFSDIKVTQ